MPSNTQQLLKNYHDASKRVEIIGGAFLAEKGKELDSQLLISARELVSRCILSDDPRSLVCLFLELEILLRVLGQLASAECAGHIHQHLAKFFEKFGTF